MAAKSAVSKNLLIVESKNDQYFIEGLIKYLKLNNIELGTPICNIEDYECLGGLGNLSRRLRDLKKEIESKGLEKIGILIDADDEGIENRIELINGAIKEICSDVSFTRINEPKHSQELDIDFICYITNVNGYGELETLLKAIKSKDSTFADCLKSWRKCAKKFGREIKDKEFDKFWFNIYCRYDCCAEEERKQAGKNCNTETSLKKDIWDFEHSLLDGLKEFLRLLA
ncbi:hypothetical protein Thena_0404 [Thermodesulfobium narugense DSM 14796]|uniref:DUF4435 domain-containing protein n=1 Tax=Thermodesulfobium narugense DSM 14796 TaxID=747365 RepID=M1E687_9BACT|nr:DUF3226 domain-containing protein [Thermodesulfobium narugense]AEE14048.1 hypothetical protein Thena_0404 [Thermodesulfobium narugense DSM 14796]